MPPKKKAGKRPDVNTEGVAVRTDRYENVNRHEDGVAILVPQAPAQTAGPDNGRSADNEKEKD